MLDTAMLDKLLAEEYGTITELLLSKPSRLAQFVKDPQGTLTENLAQNF